MQPPNGNNPFGPSQNPYGAPPSPYGAAQNPFAPTQNPFGSPGPNLPAQPPKKTSKLFLLLAAVPALAVAACLTAYFIDSRGHENASVLAQVCDGTRSARAAAYLPGALPHRLAWFNHGGGEWSHDGSPPVPRAWSTLWGDEAQVVVCAEAPVNQVIERCPFTGGRFVERRQWQQGIRLVVASTGQVLTQATVTGGAPPTCGSTVSFAGNHNVAYDGPAIGDSVAGPLLEPFITR